ncbi:hypothetical protein CUT44_18320 [Streptomyces carminius]|uniref:Secreted protein n=1 Tax=Streptomyces carminius TaxID=2665496 RepID=A0A2M8LWZ7_9ACTN|nr:hypothetical protein [Streptomyces carminius]PJE96454.1 hypothetical protein CUT44_18320 [Streptomyces carminius]
MKSWRSRIAAGLAVCATAVALPLTVGSASAAAASDWRPVGGGYRTYLSCYEDALDYLKYNETGYTQFHCRPNGDTWDVWFR